MSCAPDSECGCGAASRPAHDSGERPENECRYLSGKANQSEQEQRAGESVDEPACCDARDPRSDQGYTLTGEEEPVIPALKSSC